MSVLAHSRERDGLGSPSYEMRSECVEPLRLPWRLIEGRGSSNGVSPLSARCFCQRMLSGGPVGLDRSDQGDFVARGKERAAHALVPDFVGQLGLVDAVIAALFEEIGHVGQCED